MSQTRIVSQEINCCNDCLYVTAFSVNCVAHVSCGKSTEKHPSDGKDGTAIIHIEIPDFCPLPIKQRYYEKTKNNIQLNISQTKSL